MRFIKKILSILILSNIASCSSTAELKGNSTSNIEKNKCQELFVSSFYEDAFLVCNKSASLGSREGANKFLM